MKELKDYEYYKSNNATIYNGECLDVLKTLPDESINMVMTSPPYWALRDYGAEGQLGLEPTFQEYINRLCDIFDEVKRVLKNDGTCWVNIGDTYMGNSSYSEKGRQGYEDKKCNINKIIKATDGEKYGTDETRLKCFGSDELKNKCLCQIPSRFSIEMTNRGWILRNEIIWYKPNCMPASVKDRFTVDFEKMFFFVKNKKYWFEQQIEDYQSEPEGLRNKGNENFGINALGNGKQAMSKGERDWYNKGGRNKRCIWAINPKPYAEAHFAVYPEELCQTPIRAGCPEKGVVLDMFAGSSTTGLVSLKLDRQFIGIELKKEYCELGKNRIDVYESNPKFF